jgi:hypothetical protein
MHCSLQPSQQSLTAGSQSNWRPTGDDTNWQVSNKSKVTTGAWTNNQPGMKQQASYDYGSGVSVISVSEVDCCFNSPIELNSSFIYAQFSSSAEKLWMNSICSVMINSEVFVVFYPTFLGCFEQTSDSY